MEAEEEDERIKQDGVFQPSAMAATLTILTVVGAEPDVDGWREKKEERSGAADFVGDFA